MSAPDASRDARFAAALVTLRSPLACISLGADQLLRDAPTPAARALAETIAAAVQDIDAGLDAVLRGLFAPEAGAATVAESDCRSAIAASWERITPLLRGRGVEAELCLSPAPVPGDAGRLRRLATALVRDALVAPRFALRMWDEGSHYGLELGLPPSNGPGLQPSNEPGLQPSNEPGLPPSNGPGLQPSNGPGPGPSVERAGPAGPVDFSAARRLAAELGAQSEDCAGGGLRIALSRGAGV